MVNFTEIIQTIKSLVETRIELVKSDIQDQLVGILSRLILLILIGSILLVSGLFLVVFLYFTKDSQGFQQQFNAFLKKSIFNSPSRKNSNE